MDPDPTPDLTSFFIEFKDAKKIFLFHIFFLELAHRHIIFSLKNLIFFSTFVVKSYFADIISTHF
jgi:hypothetical protein